MSCFAASRKVWYRVQRLSAGASRSILHLQHRKKSKIFSYIMNCLKGIGKKNCHIHEWKTVIEETQADITIIVFIDSKSRVNGLATYIHSHNTSRDDK